MRWPSSMRFAPPLPRNRCAIVAQSLRSRGPVDHSTNHFAMISPAWLPCQTIARCMRDVCAMYARCMRDVSPASALQMEAGRPIDRLDGGRPCSVPAHWLPCRCFQLGRPMRVLCGTDAVDLRRPLHATRVKFEDISPHVAQWVHRPVPGIASNACRQEAEAGGLAGGGDRTRTGGGETWGLVRRTHFSRGVFYGKRVMRGVACVQPGGV